MDEYESLSHTSSFHFNDQRHSIDWDRPAEHVLARSLDGGLTWTLEHHPDLKPPDGAKAAGVLTAPGGRAPIDCPGGVDFTHAGFALTARMESVDIGPSRLYYTYDRGHSWLGPYKVPDFGQPGIAARTDYLIDGPHAMTIFLTAAKSNGKQGRVICVRALDGARTWKLISFAGPEPGPRRERPEIPTSGGAPLSASLPLARNGLSARQLL